VLLNVTENLEIGAAPAEVWKLMNDTVRLAALVPGVEEASRIEGAEQESYHVRVTEKVGPFKVTMKLEVTVTERVEPSIVGASVKGGDAKGMGRATGTIGVRLAPMELGTALTVTVNVEVLGKLATLGAPVIRRRVTELFGEFGRRVVAEFQAGEA
jgi:carbon monoxide dehydrogenase subunit G